MSTVALEESLRERRNVCLPEGWSHADLGRLGTWGSGGTPSKSNSAYWVNGSIPWVSPKDMKVDTISGSQESITEKALATARLHLLPAGTIIFVVRGMILAHSFPVALTACPVVINQDMRSLIPVDGIHPVYLYWALRSETQHILAIVRDSTHGTRRIESDALKLWPIAVAPYDEQVRIVDRINRLREKIAGASLKLRKIAHVFGFETTARRQSPLLQTVLCKAFAGELVETEADIARREGRGYEPAAVLLQRIAVGRSVVASPVRLERGRAVLDILLLLEAWNQPVSVSALEPALVLMRNDAARQVLLNGHTTRRRGRSLATEPQFVSGLDVIYSGLEANGAIRRVGQSGFELLNSRLLARASTMDRARATEVLQAIQTLSDLRSLPMVVAEITHERYEITV